MFRVFWAFVAFTGGLLLVELPFEHILGVGQASTLNVDGGFDAWRRVACGFMPPGRPWERLYGLPAPGRYPTDLENGRSPYIASEQVLSWAQKEGWWR